MALLAPFVMSAPISLADFLARVSKLRTIEDYDSKCESRISGLNEFLFNISKRLGYLEIIEFRIDMK